MRKVVLLVGLVLGCGGASTPVEAPPAAPTSVASAPPAPAESATPAPPAPAESASPAPPAPAETAATQPEAAPPKKTASRYSVDGVDVMDVDAAIMAKKLSKLGLAIDIPGTTGTMVAGKWETFNFGAKKGGKRHGLVVIVRPAKQPATGSDPLAEKYASPQVKFEQHKRATAAVLDEEAGVMIAVGLYKACAATDPHTCKGGVVETDPAPAKKLFDSIFTTK
jgi:hypothetical protein